MTMFSRSSLVSFSALALVLSLTGCLDYTGPVPDNRIRLMPLANGNRMVAIPPECLSWRDAATGPMENQPWPQFGCASARNLAAQVANSEDLINSRDLGNPDAYTSATSIKDYRAGQTKALVDAKAEAPVASMPAATGAMP